MKAGDQPDLRMGDPALVVDGKVPPDHALLVQRFGLARIAPILFQTAGLSWIFQLAA